MRRCQVVVLLVTVGFAQGRVAVAQTVEPARSGRFDVQNVAEVKDSAPPPAVVLDLTGGWRLFRSPEAGVFGGAAALDGATTVHFLVFHHGHEDNPLIKWAPTTASTIAFGAALDVTTLAVWERLTREHPHVQKLGLYVAAGARVFVAGRNEYRIARARSCAPPPVCQFNCLA